MEKKTGHEDEKGVAVETVSDNKEAEEENLEKLKGQLDQLHLDVKTTASKLSQVWVLSLKKKLCQVWGVSFLKSSLV